MDFLKIILFHNLNTYKIKRKKSHSYNSIFISKIIFFKRLIRYIKNKTIKKLEEKSYFKTWYTLRKFWRFDNFL